MVSFADVGWVAEEEGECSTRQRSQSWSHYNLIKLYLVQEIRGNVIKHTDQDTY